MVIHWPASGIAAQLARIVGSPKLHLLDERRQQRGLTFAHGAAVRPFAPLTVNDGDGNNFASGAAVKALLAPRLLRSRCRFGSPPAGDGLGFLQAGRWAHASGGFGQGGGVLAGHGFGVDK